MTPLHPSIVHFPVALLLAAGLCYAASLVVKRLPLDVVGFLLHAAGLVTCIVAIFTGDYEADKAQAVAGVLERISAHEQMVTIATYGFGLMGIWAFLRQKSGIIFERVAFVVLFLGLYVALAIGAHRGGELVFRDGVGVQNLPSATPSSSSLQP